VERGGFVSVHWLGMAIAIAVGIENLERGDTP
jgi:hypothetical protein